MRTWDRPAGGAGRTLGEPGPPSVVALGSGGRPGGQERGGWKMDDARRTGRREPSSARRAALVPSGSKSGANQQAHSCAPVVGVGAGGGVSGSRCSEQSGPEQGFGVAGTGAGRDGSSNWVNALSKLGKRKRWSSQPARAAAGANNSTAAGGITTRVTDLNRYVAGPFVT